MIEEVSIILESQRHDQDNKSIWSGKRIKLENFKTDKLNYAKVLNIISKETNSTGYIILKTRIDLNDKYFFGFIIDEIKDGLKYKDSIRFLTESWEGVLTYVIATLILSSLIAALSSIFLW